MNERDRSYRAHYTAAQRAYYRYAKCRPVFRRLKARFEELERTELPSSHLGDAARYALSLERVGALRQARLRPCEYLPEPDRGQYPPDENRFE
jgi:hypothetical protein